MSETRHGPSKMTLRLCVLPFLESDEDTDRVLALLDWHLAPIKDDVSLTIGAISGPRETALNVNTVTETELNSQAKAADKVLFWKTSEFWAAPPAIRRKALRIDTSVELDVGDALDQFVHGHSPISLDIAAEQTKLTDVGHYKANADVVIIGSGLMAPGTLEHFSSPPLAVYLGTTIFNAGLLNALPPDIIIAADVPSQLGHGRTAALYREKVTDLIRTHNSHVVVPAHHKGSVLCHWPDDVTDNFIFVPINAATPLANSLHIQLACRPTGNVLTTLGLPVAASLGTHVHLIGISLGEAGPDASWSHSEQSFYQRHTASMMIDHPAASAAGLAYMRRHLDMLHGQMKALSEAHGTNFMGPLGKAIDHSQSGPVDGNIGEPSALRLSIFKAVSKLEHQPLPILAGVFAVTCLVSLTAAATLIGPTIAGFVMLALLLTGMAALFLFTRIRMNRMMTDLQSKLSTQQTRQFKNLSDRLEAIESKLSD